MWIILFIGLREREREREMSVPGPTSHTKLLRKWLVKVSKFQSYDPCETKGFLRWVLLPEVRPNLLTEPIINSLNEVSLALHIYFFL